MTSAVTFFRVLADPVRWRIVRLAMDQALCVCELADILGMPQSTVSSHVQIIRKAGLLDSETCGKWTYFRIAREHLGLLRQCIRSLPEHPQYTQDIQRLQSRLAVRASSCCPGPQILKPRIISTACSPHVKGRKSKV